MVQHTQPVDLRRRLLVRATSLGQPHAQERRSNRGLVRPPLAGVRGHRKGSEQFGQAHLGHPESLVQEEWGTDLKNSATRKQPNDVLLVFGCAAQPTIDAVQYSGE
jgi:hypothetical protein